MLHFFLLCAWRYCSAGLFEVEFGKGKSVATLKEARKEKKSHRFSDVDADSLVLWDVNTLFG